MEMKMKIPNKFKQGRTALFALAPLALIGGTIATGGLGLTGCDALAKLTGEVLPPGVSLDRVDLVDYPSITKMTNYACNLVDPTGFTCDGDPPKSDMLFSFDVVFDVKNENEKLPIPLIEVLLGISVFDGDDLGAMCISFCDPDSEDCTASTNAEDACDVDSAKEVDEPSDLVPNGDGIRGLAEDIASGDFGYNNDEFRVIKAGESMEAHIQFDLDIDTMLEVGSTAIARAIGGGGFSVPYEVEGTLFFDVPEFGRYAFGFGPFPGEWDVW
jgi:hypothetical protein